MERCPSHSGDDTQEAPSCLNGIFIVLVRWVDTNKGSDEVLMIRSRLVARDFREKGDKERQGVFAATLPLETETYVAVESRELEQEWQAKEVALHRRENGTLEEPCVRPGRELRGI